MIDPVKIERNGGTSITITWNDGSSSQIPSVTLRSNCPCATCREQRGDEGHSKPIASSKKPISMLKVIQHSKDEELNLMGIKVVGNYAINIEWQDGHSTGIYPFGLLRELSQV